MSNLIDYNSFQNLQTTIKGRGNFHVLNCDPSQQHQLTFQLSPELDVSRPPIPISRTLVDQVNKSNIVADC